MATKSRLVEYDLLRIFACLCVIMIHSAVFNQADLYTKNSFEYQAINIWGVLSRWAVPAFVMLSGMFALPHADDMPIRRLFAHRVFRMLIVYIVWSCVYSAYNVYVLGNVYASTRFKTFIDGCFSGELHMWYLPMLAGLYLISPLLWKLIKKLDRKYTIYWLIGLFVFTSVIPFVIKLNIKFVSVIIDSISGYMALEFLKGWTLYFVLGYYLKEHSFSKKEKIIALAGSLLGLLFSLYGTIVYCLQHGAALGILPYEYPNIVLFSIGVILLFKEKVSLWKINEIIKRCISKVAELTFGVYLIHVLILKVLYQLGINIQLFHPILSIPCIAVIVFVLGGAITWIIRQIPVIGKYIA